MKLNEILDQVKLDQLKANLDDFFKFYRESSYNIDSDTNKNYISIVATSTSPSPLNKLKRRFADAEKYGAIITLSGKKLIIQLPKSYFEK